MANSLDYNSVSIVWKQQTCLQVRICPVQGPLRAFSPLVEEWNSSSIVHVLWGTTLRGILNKKLLTL